MNEMKPTIPWLRNCARCGRNHHEVPFEKLAIPCGEFTHWAQCPTNGQPIMIAFTGALSQPEPTKEHPMPDTTSEADWAAFGRECFAACVYLDRAVPVYGRNNVERIRFAADEILRLRQENAGLRQANTKETP